jgi:hypothetical protein
VNFTASYHGPVDFVGRPSSAKSTAASWCAPAQHIIASRTANRRIVCEAKEEASYDLRRSLDQIGTAKANEGTDAYLSAGLMICKALAVRNTTANDEIAADIDLLEKAIREIERQSGFLEEIKTSSSTIKNGQ